MDIGAAVAAHLAGDATLTGQLAIYGDQPAIFTFDPVPADAQRPFVVSSSDDDQRPHDTKTTRGRVVDRQVRVYVDADGDDTLVNAIAERIRALLHRHELAIPGAQTVVAEAFGPRIAATTPDLYGRTVTVRLTIQEA